MGYIRNSLAVKVHKWDLRIWLEHLWDFKVYVIEYYRIYPTDIQVISFLYCIFARGGLQNVFLFMFAHVENPTGTHLVDFGISQQDVRERAMDHLNILGYDSTAQDISGASHRNNFGTSQRPRDALRISLISRDTTFLGRIYDICAIWGALVMITLGYTLLWTTIKNRWTLDRRYSPDR